MRILLDYSDGRYTWRRCLLQDPESRPAVPHADIGPATRLLFWVAMQLDWFVQRRLGKMDNAWYKRLHTDCHCRECR